MSSAKFIVYYKYKGASKLLKVGENNVWVSNSLDPDETPSHNQKWIFVGPVTDCILSHNKSMICFPTPAGHGAIGINPDKVELQKTNKHG